MASTEAGGPGGAGAGFFSSALAVFSGGLAFGGSCVAGAATFALSGFGAGSVVAFAAASGFGAGSAVLRGLALTGRFPAESFAALSDVVVGAGDEGPAPVVGGAGSGASAFAAVGSAVPSAVAAGVPVRAVTTKPTAGSPVAATAATAVAAACGAAGGAAAASFAR